MVPAPGRAPQRRRPPSPAQSDGHRPDLRPDLRNAGRGLDPYQTVPRLNSQLEVGFASVCWHRSWVAFIGLVP